MQIKKVLSNLIFPFTVMLIIFLSIYPKLPQPPVTWNFFDKIEHLIAYAFLSTAGIFFFKQFFSRFFIQIFLNAGICIVLGGVIELVQPAFGRHSELMDFAINSAGVFSVSTIAWIIHCKKNPAD